MSRGVTAIRHSDHRIEAHRAGVPLFVQNAEPDKRPFIHPLVAPDCNGILTEDAPPHHPWQHGLYVGLNDVNGVGFWAENLLRGKPGYDNDGTFHPRPLEMLDAEHGNADEAIRWRVTTDWRDPRGRTMLVEMQTWRYTWRSDSLATLDLEWSLKASIDLRFGAFAYGGLFLRMPFAPERGTKSLTSDGFADQQGEGKAARWVAVAMPIPGRDTPAGIAILDHPKNPAHPTPFRIDGQFGVGPARCIRGAWLLPRGDIATERYRLCVFTGDIDAPALDREWQAWTMNG